MIFQDKFLQYLVVHQPIFCFLFKQLSLFGCLLVVVYSLVIKLTKQDFTESLLYEKEGGISILHQYNAVQKYCKKQRRHSYKYVPSFYIYLYNNLLYIDR